MTDRNPTSFDTTYDSFDMMPGSQVTTTAPALIATNQQLVRDKASFIAGDMFYPFSSTAGAWTTLARIFVGFDHCGVSDAAGATVEIAFMAWASDASNFSVAFQAQNVPGGPLRYVAAVAASHTSKVWRPVTTSPRRIDADGTEEELHLQVQRTSGSGTIYVAGYHISTIAL